MNLNIVFIQIFIFIWFRTLLSFCSFLLCQLSSCISFDISPLLLIHQMCSFSYFFASWGLSIKRKGNNCHKEPFVSNRMYVGVIFFQKSYEIMWKINSSQSNRDSRKDSILHGSFLSLYGVVLLWLSPYKYTPPIW